jgi:hypothetical protein
MVENFTAIQNLLVTRITNDLNNGEPDIFGKVLDAYNRYQEDERGAVDYIFDLTNQSDLKFLVDNGLCATEIAAAMRKIEKENYTSFFHYGCNYPTLHALGTTTDVKRNLISWLPEIIPYVLMYVTRCTEYQAIYEHYITEYLESKDFGK